MYASVRDEIQDVELDVVNREVSTDYIVALVHENEQDIPVPIGGYHFLTQPYQF
jgi:hypothetical protein